MKKNVIEIFIITITAGLFALWGFGLGSLIKQKEIEKQTYINTQLELEYNDLRANYDTLEINYRWELEQAREYIIKLENNRYDVNLDGEVNAADYVAIKNYIMNEE